MRDDVVAKGCWSFDADVTACFDDMLERSIPQYEVMRSSVLDLAIRYFQDGTDIVDLGASRGGSLAPIVNELGSKARRIIGIEVSKPMLEALCLRFANNNVVHIEEMDLRSGYPSANASVTLLVLTLQFTPIEHRLRILRNAFESTVPGGALILVEKVLGATANIDESFVDLHLGMKRINGYSEEQIELKKLSLEGVLVPVAADWNVDILRRSGFGEVDCFWRWMNFAGWIAIKN